MAFRWRIMSAILIVVIALACASASQPRKPKILSLAGYPLKTTIFESLGPPSFERLRESGMYNSVELAAAARLARTGPRLLRVQCEPDQPCPPPGPCQGDFQEPATPASPTTCINSPGCPGDNVQTDVLNAPQSTGAIYGFCGYPCCAENTTCNNGAN